MSATVTSSLFDVPAVISDALGAAKTTAGPEFKKVQDVVATCTQQLAVLAADIATKRAANKITADEADMLIQLQKGSFRVFMLNVEGVTALAIEAIINAVINVFVAALNAAVNAGLTAI